MKQHIRTVVRVVLVLISGIALSVFVVVHWAEQQLLTTDNWVALVAPLPKQQVVSDALGAYIGNSVFSAVPVQNKIADALPPRAAFLADPLAGQLQELTVKAARGAVQSDTFQTIWSGANRIALNRLLATARGETPPLQAKINERFNLDLSNASGQVQKALGSAAQALPALQPAAHKTIALSTDLKAKPQRVHQVIRTLDYLAAILPVLSIASLLGALAVSDRRRKTVMAFSGTIIILMFIELIALKVLRGQVLDQVHRPENIPAISYIFDTLVIWLRHMMYWVLAGATVVLAICLVLGYDKWMRGIRRLVHFERLTNSALFTWWHTVRGNVRTWEAYVCAGIAAVVLGYAALFMTITTRSATNALLLVLGLCALTHIIATPPSKRKPSKRVTGVTAAQ
ncbi:MAG TPA: hypothetical protein VLE73_00750 [Candidatus Saccharimonadales bacterium]|nr:hypothetical protein [Candidatus Saccharimonadales bacterium]